MSNYTANALPKDWKWMRLGEVCDVITGTTPSKSDLSNYGNDILFIKPPQLWDKPIYDTVEKLSYKGAVLVTCIGNLGRTGLVKKSAAFNQQLNAILENEIIDGKYIFYLAQSPSFKKQLEYLSSATTVAIVNKGKFETIEIPLPPLKDQYVIVSKIEELFSELDKGIEQLKTAQQQLKVYRQAVLKWAFEGRLTNENVIDGELPKGWKWIKLKEVCNKIETVKRKEKDPNEEFIYLDIGGLDNVVNKIVSHKNYQWRNAPSRAQQIIIVNDILFSTVRTYLKNIAMVENKIYNGQIASSGFCIIRAKKEILYSRFIFYYSISEYFLKPLNELQTGSSYPAVRDKDVFSQKILIPKLEEQYRIVSEIENRYSITNKIEGTITTNLQQAEALKQSILKKAFEGKLL